MQQATRVSDYTAFFMLGEIVEYDTTEELFKNPKKKRQRIILQEGLVKIYEARTRN